jgi:glutamine synthetase
MYQNAEARDVPKTLREAAALMSASAMLRDAFGGAVIDHYHRAALWEIEEMDRVVTDWEVAHGFERA